jgi:hypothetical protein
MVMVSIHICIAIASLLVGAACALRPNRRLFVANYALIGATFATGISLIALQPAHLGSACLSGLTYLAIITALSVAAQRRLAHAEATH